MSAELISFELDNARGEIDSCVEIGVQNILLYPSLFALSDIGKEFIEFAFSFRVSILRPSLRRTGASDLACM